MEARDALAEAVEVAGPRAWVLEPSPPANTAAPFFADDPVAAGDLEWEPWVAAHDDRALWGADRWLAGGRGGPGRWGAAGPRPGPAPAKIVDTRRALHRLAFYVVAPARKRANTK